MREAGKLCSAGKFYLQVSLQSDRDRVEVIVPEHAQTVVAVKVTKGEITQNEFIANSFLKKSRIDINIR